MRDSACSPGVPVSPGSSRPRRRAAGARAFLRYAFERLGFGFRHARMSLWLHGGVSADFDRVEGLLREVLAGRRDIAVVITAADRATVGLLRARFPDDVVCATPGAVAGSLGRFLARRRPCALALLDGGASLGGRTLAHLRRLALPCLPAARASDLRAQLPPAAADVPTTGSWQATSLRDRMGQGRAWAGVAPLFMRRRFDDWESLRARLARPRSILCLGNGPSSEDPRLGGIEHDCLIRSNWRWLERGFLARPHLVFVGDPATIRRVRGCVFGFWNVELEHGMLLRHLVVRGPAAMEYVTMERLSPLVGRGRWPARPSNGALAIVAAAALAPERLVIAGMDLFQHPAGRYADAPDARNDYSSVHRVDVEVALIDLALRGYSGEVVIVGDILSDRLARHRDAGEGAA